MNKNNIYLLFGILIILLVIFVAQKNSAKNSSNDLLSKKRIVAFEDIRDVDAVSVKTPELEISMTKNDGEWKTDVGYAIYKESIEEFLTLVKDTTIHSVVSDSVENLEDYFLDEENAYEYVFESEGEVVGSFRIGQGDFGSAYLILDGEKEIVSVRDPDYLFFNYEWRDRVIEDTPSRFIREVIISKSNSFTTMKREVEKDEDGRFMDVWYINGIPADQDKAKQYVSGLTTATASNFPKPDAEFISSGTTVKLKTEDNSFLITIGQNTDDGQTMIKNSKGLLYYINTKNTLPKFVITQSDVL